MTGDDVLAIRKQWEQYNYADYLPEATVLASHDWTLYVRTMAQAVPRDLTEVHYPTEAEVRWAWTEGVAVVFDQPFDLEHLIISRDKSEVGVFGISTKVEDVAPTIELQQLQGVVFGIGQMMRARVAGSEEKTTESIYAIPTLFIGTDPEDIISGTWIPGGDSHVMHGQQLSESSAFQLSLVTALGHRLTKEVPVPSAGRGERRRVQRELPSLRMLSLAGGASVSEREGSPQRHPHQFRWIVRGHWHTVRHGPRKTLSRLQWYDPFVKGPEDKPLDERRTVWRT